MLQLKENTTLLGGRFVMLGLDYPQMDCDLPNFNDAAFRVLFFICSSIPTIDIIAPISRARIKTKGDMKYMKSMIFELLYKVSNKVPAARNR